VSKLSDREFAPGGQVICACRRDANLSGNTALCVVAWYAAIVSTFGLLISLYTVWKDRVRLAITITPDMLLIEGHRYDPSKTYISVTIRNRGRRATKISTVYLKLYRTRGYFFLKDSMYQLNRVLTEENPRTNVMIDQDLVDPSRIEYAVVNDEAGYKHVKYYRLGAFFLRHITRWVYNLDYLELPDPHKSPPVAPSDHSH
jgi:hypothetical protein